MYTYDQLQVGTSFRVERHIGGRDVQTFAHLTGDDNPIHLDAAYAAATPFGKPIVHGAFLMGLVSKVLGRDFPGPGSVAVRFSCRFLRPVPVGATVAVEIKVVEKLDRHRHIRSRVCVYCGDTMALAGEAVVLPPSSHGGG